MTRLDESLVNRGTAHLASDMGLLGGNESSVMKDCVEENEKRSRERLIDGEEDPWFRSHEPCQWQTKRNYAITFLICICTNILVAPNMPEQ